MDSEENHSKASICIGFTGSREGLSAKQCAVLKALWDILCEMYSVTEIRHGDCVGADAEFHNMVRHRSPSVRISIHPPAKDVLRARCEGDVVLDPKEYLERNRDIVDNSNIVLACPSGKKTGGTWSTINYAATKQVATIILYPDGSREMHNFH